MVSVESLNRSHMLSRWPRVSRILRFVGLLIWNALIALFGTKMFTSPFASVFSNRPLELYTVKADAVCAAAALFVGCFAYSRWRQEPAKWVWLLGLCWFGQRASLWWLEQTDVPGTIRHNICWEMCGTGEDLDATRFAEWAGYTLPFVLTSFYSLGAFGYSRLIDRFDSARRKRLQTSR